MIPKSKPKRCHGGKVSDDTMYEAITNAFPLFDCPLTFYSEFVLEFDEDAKSAEKARKKMARKASEAMARSKSKLGNKRRCIDFEKKVRQQETHTSELTTAPALAAAQKATKWTVGVGCRVQVADDLTPGMCSFGGTGYIQAFSGSDNSHRTFTVKYDEFEAGGTEHGIEYSRLTEVLLGARPSARNAKRPTILTDVTNNPKAKQKPDKLHLLLAWSCSRNYSKGWRARDAGVADAKRSDRFRSLFLQDVKELQGYLSAKPETTHYQEKRKSGGKFKKRSNLFDPLTKRYLCHAWGVGITAPKRMLIKNANVAANVAAKASNPKPNPTRWSGIESIEAAKIHYKANRLYVEAFIRKKVADDSQFAYEKTDQSRKAKWQSQAKRLWSTGLSEATKEVWHAKERSYLVA